MISLQDITWRNLNILNSFRPGNGGGGTPLRPNIAPSRIVTFAVFLLFSSALLHAQARPTATRSVDIQAGGGFVYAGGDSPYDSGKFKGLFGYADFDVLQHFGAEFEIHQIYSGNNDDVNERTYELGVRYFRTYGRVVPYAKGLYGRGVFNFPQNQANLAFNLAAAGAGLDYRLARHVNLRAEYEYQHWLNFPAGNTTSISPNLVSVGAAYHFR